MLEEITELERRISAAFDRMDQGLDLLARARAAAAQDAANAATAAELPSADAAPVFLPEPSPPEPSPAAPALLRALELARASSDDWAERYRALQAQMGAETIAMAEEITRLTEELAAARRAPTSAPPSVQDTDINAEIDELTAQIAAQEAELELLRAARISETAELGEIISALAPLVEEAADV